MLPIDGPCADRIGHHHLQHRVCPEGSRGLVSDMQLLTSSKHKPKGKYALADPSTTLAEDVDQGQHEDDIAGHLDRGCDRGKPLKHATRIGYASVVTGCG